MRELEARLCLSAGDLEPSFGHDGVLVDSSLNSISGLVVQPDGKILLNNSQRIYRRKADGSADLSFGDDGVVTAPIAILGMKLASDGKILLGGMTNNGWTAARLLADGSPDPTFHAVVKRVTGTFGDAGASGFGVDSRGRILVGGSLQTYGDDPNVEGDEDNPEFDEAAIIRFNADGSLDTTYGTNGIATGGTLNRFSTMAVAPDGSAVIGGQFNSGSSTHDEVYVAFDPAGRMAYTSPSDSGGSGLTADNIRASAFLADSTQLLGDEVKGASNVYIGKPGSNDVRIYFSPVDNDGYTDGKINAILPTPDGKILVGGFGGDVNPGLGLVRLNADGSSDTSFAFGGRESVDINRRKLEWISDLAVTPDGDILAAGRVGGTDWYDGTDGTFFLAKFEGGAHPVGEQAPRARSQVSQFSLPGAGTTDMTFEVNYAAEESIDTSSLSRRDVRVLGPNGYSVLARFTGVTERDDHKAWIATYTIPAPNGEWGRAANGHYSIYVRPNQVLDNRGHAVPAGVVGTFDIYFPRSKRRHAAASVQRSVQIASPFATTATTLARRSGADWLQDGALLF
jgi:uncharacterized delta-60 repeat protein